MRVLITAGGTREPIDEARVIANTSTGRLGARVAGAAVAAGHEVLLLHGMQAARPGSARVRCEVFDTGGELARLLERHAPQADAVFHAAAVSDFVPTRRRTGARKRRSNRQISRVRHRPTAGVPQCPLYSPASALGPVQSQVSDLAP